LILLLFVFWITSLFAVIALVRPLMVSRSAWYGLLILLYFFVSLGVYGYGTIRVLRWFGLRCPHCGATFLYGGVSRPFMSPEEFVERERRCGWCHAIPIDLDS